jgi:uncharacterized protein YcfJ
VIGGAVGGASGAAIGQKVGGSSGAVLGSGVGAAAGASIGKNVTENDRNSQTAKRPDAPVKSGPPPIVVQIGDDGDRNNKHHKLDKKHKKNQKPNPPGHAYGLHKQDRD